MANFLSSYGSLKKIWAKLVNSSDSPRSKRRGLKSRDELLVPACIEMLERREMLTAPTAVGVSFNAGDLLITGTGKTDAVTVVAGAHSTVVSVNGTAYSTLHNATSSNITAISFNGEGVAADSLTVSGVANNMTLSLTSVGTVGVTSAHNVTIQNQSSSQLLTLNASTVGGTLTVTSAGGVTSSAAINVTGLATFTTGTNDLTLSNKSNAFAGGLTITSNNATVNATGAVDIINSTIGGNFTLATTGNVTNTGNLLVTGNTSLGAGKNSITLNSTGVAFGGSVGFTGVNATFTNTSHNFGSGATTTTVLGATTLTGNLNVTSAGMAVTDTGKLVIGGTTTINTLLVGGTTTAAPVISGNVGVDATYTSTVVQTQVTSYQDITLNATGNTFTGALLLTGNVLTVTSSGAVVMGATSALKATTTTTTTTVTTYTEILDGQGNPVTDGQGNLTYTNAVGAPSVAVTYGAVGNLSVTAAGKITDSGAVNVTGSTTYAAGKNAITLSNASSTYDGVINLAGAAVSITNLGNVNLGTVTTTGAFTVSTASDTHSAGNGGEGDVSNSGVLTIGGLLTITANSGSSNITLSTGNTYTGAISLDGNTVHLTSNPAGTALTFGAVTATNLTLTVAGGLTSTAAFTVSGTTTIITGTNSATLSNKANAFTGALILTGDNMTITAAGDVVIGASTISGNLSLTTTGNITNSTAFDVTGTTSLNAGKGKDVTLTGNCGFVGAIGFTGRNATFTNTSYNGSEATVLGATTLTGNLNVTSAGMAVTDTGKLVIGGTTTINTQLVGSTTTAAPVIVGNVGVDATYTSTVVQTQVTSYQDITLNATGNTFTGALLLTGNVLTVTSGGAVVMGATSALKATTTTTTTTVTTYTEILDGQGNPVTDGQGNLTYTNAVGAPSVAVTYGAVGNLSVTAAGKITDSGAVNVTGSTTYAAGKNAITLSNASSTYDGVINLTGAAVSITNLGDVNLGTVTTTGAFTVLTASDTHSAGNGGVGNVSNSGVLTIGGLLTITANSGSSTITLSSGNTYTGAISLDGSTVSLTSTSATTALTFGAVTATNLTLTVDGGLTSTAAFTVSGTTTIATGTKNATLSNKTNAFTGALHLSGTNFAITAAGAVVIGSSAVTGTLAVTTTGNITDSGVITVAGTTTLNAGTANITLSHNNSFGGAIGFTGGNATFTNTSYNFGSGATTTTNLGPSTLTGNLVVTSAGMAVTDSGKLIIGGTTTITTQSVGTTSTAAPVIVGNVGVDPSYTSTVVQTQVTTYQNITLNATGNTFGGALLLTGNVVTVTAAGAVIVGATDAIQSTVTTTTTTVTTYTEILDGQGNPVTDGQGNLTYTSSAAAPSVAVTYGSAGNMSVTAKGSITDAGAVDVTGTSSFNAGSNSVTLTNAGSTYDGAISLVGKNVTVDNIGNVVLGTVTTSGTLSITTVDDTNDIGNGGEGDVTNTGVLTIGGLLTISAEAGSGNITLAPINGSSPDTYSGGTDLTGNNVSVS